MIKTNSEKIAHDMGDASFYLHNFHFKQDICEDMCTLHPSPDQGVGDICQIQPADGFFISTGDWIPYESMERKYKINQKLVKMYYLESGGVILIQNGKKAQTINEGIHLYLNRPSQGRVVYQPNIPIQYISVLLFDDFIEKYFGNRFSENDFDYAEVYDWKIYDYNTPEIGSLFLQIRKKLLSGENSKLYYKSKIGELLSLVASNFHNQRRLMEEKKLLISKQDQAALEAVRQAIDTNIFNSPDIEHLCKISAMGQTKLRELFKSIYGQPIGSYIRQTKMQYALLLLEKPNLTIGSIATHLGYANASKFSAAFQKFYNQTPDSYKKKAHKKPGTQ